VIILTNLYVAYICAAGHRAGFFFQVLETSPVQGRFCRNFLLIVLFFFVLQSRTCRGDLWPPEYATHVAAGGRLVLMANRVRNTRGLVPIRSTATLGCPAALLRAPDTRTRTSRRQSRPCGRHGQVGALHTLGGTHPGRRGQMGARDTTEAMATTGQSHNTRGEALASDFE
jgi:hypothetical protein